MKKMGLPVVLFAFLLLPMFADADNLDIWHWRSPLQPEDELAAVAYGNGTFVAVGDKGLILVSADGLTWTWVLSGTSSDLWGIDFGGKLFVAVGNEIILVSRDAETWTSEKLDALNDLVGVTYGKNVYVAVGFGPGQAMGGVVFTSADGSDWTRGDPGAPACFLQGVDFGKNLFVAVGHFLMDGDYIIRTSTDGMTWTGETWGAQKTLLDIVYGNTTFVAVGLNTYENTCFIQTSGDGVAWTPATTSSCAGILNGIAFGNGTFAAVGSEGAILTSTDGIAWTTRLSGVGSNLQGVAYGERTFVAVGTQGAILQSDPFPETDGGKNRCFIASAAFNSDLAPEVAVLRNFRDRHLLTSQLGRILVNGYYRWSPPWAGYLEDHPSLKPLVRSLLGVVAFALKQR